MEYPHRAQVFYALVAFGVCWLQQLPHPRRNTRIAHGTALSEVFVYALSTRSGVILMRPSRFFAKWDPEPVPSWNDVPPSSRSPGLVEPPDTPSVDPAVLAEEMRIMQEVSVWVIRSEIRSRVP